MNKGCKRREKAICGTEGEEKKSCELFLTCDLAEKNSQKTWYLVSGWSNHLINNRKLFADFNDKYKKKIKLGDNKAFYVTSNRCLQIPSKQGIKKTHDTYFTPGLRHHILTVGQLYEKEVQG